MPLTEFQRSLLADLATETNDDRYLAGAAAIHFHPNSIRYSDDLDFFHDSEAKVAAAFAADRMLLERKKYAIEVELSQPGFIRATVTRRSASTRVDWAHDSAWRFMPLVRDPLGGLLLHPIDLAVNKVLALAGRDEPRDFVDVLFVHREVLPLAALCWAAPGKDPGFNPLSLLDLLKRRGRYHIEDFDRLRLTQPFELGPAKTTWLAALSEAETFAAHQPPDEMGCLYYSASEDRFVMPPIGARLTEAALSVHFGRVGGIIPRVSESQDP